MSRLSSASTETQETLSDCSNEVGEEEEGEKVESTHELKSRLMKICHVSVICGPETAVIDLNVGDFNFLDMDCWVRSRFGVDPKTKLKYCDERFTGEFVDFFIVRVMFSDRYFHL